MGQVRDSTTDPFVPETEKDYSENGELGMGNWEEGFSFRELCVFSAWKSIEKVSQNLANRLTQPI